MALPLCTSYQFRWEESDENRRFCVSVVWVSFKTSHGNLDLKFENIHGIDLLLLRCFQAAGETPCVKISNPFDFFDLLGNGNTLKQ